MNVSIEFIKYRRHSVGFDGFFEFQVVIANCCFYYFIKLGPRFVVIFHGG